jgi:hypothetical protein
LLHEFFAATAGTAIAVLAQEGHEDILFDGSVEADLGPGLREFLRVAGEEPCLDFFDGSAADELGSVLGFQLGELVCPALVLAVSVREEQKKVESAISFADFG